MERRVLFAGSFDPFTLGHKALVDQALKLFDRVIIGVGENVSKRGLLKADARCRLIEDVYRDEPRVEVRSFSCLTATFAHQVGAQALLRGIRNAVDMSLEQQMEAVNRELNGELTTVVLFTPASVSHISSSLVRELISFGEDVSRMMPDGIDLNKYIK